MRRILSKTRSEDLALALDELLDREARVAFAMLLEVPERAAEVLSCTEAQRVPLLLVELGASALKPVFDQLAPDDAADILALLPEELRSGILEELSDEESEDLEDLMRYGADTAGGIMSTDFFALDKEMTAREAIVGLQENPDAEVVFYAYCVNEEGTLVGVLSLRRLLLVAPSTQLKEIMVSDVISVPIVMDQEEVAQIVARYDLLALPVVDEFNKLVGIVTVDDVIDVLRDEATEDMMLMAGVGEEDLAPTRSTWRSVRTRLPWLLASAGGGVGAAFLIGHFEDELVRVALLAAFIPIVIGLGGNVGVQASTIVVRGIAMGQLDVTKFGVALWGEIKVVFLLALACSGAVAVVAALMPGGGLAMAGAVATSLLSVMAFGAVLGTAVPMASYRLGIDPAVATGPVLTTSIDLIGVLIYFLIASAWLGL